MKRTAWISLMLGLLMAVSLQSFAQDGKVIKIFNQHKN